MTCDKSQKNRFVIFNFRFLSFLQVPELIWNQRIPIITDCFQAIVFTWVPCIFLFVFAPYEVLKIRPLRNAPTPWTLLNISKLVSLKNPKSSCDFNDFLNFSTKLTALTLRPKCFASLLIGLGLLQLLSIFLADDGLYSAQIVSSLFEVVSFVSALHQLAWCSL